MSIPLTRVQGVPQKNDVLLVNDVAIEAFGLDEKQPDEGLGAQPGGHY